MKKIFKAGVLLIPILFISFGLTAGNKTNTVGSIEHPFANYKSTEIGAGINHSVEFDNLNNIGVAGHFYNSSNKTQTGVFSYGIYDSTTGKYNFQVYNATNQLGWGDIINFNIDKENTSTTITRVLLSTYNGLYLGVDDTSNSSGFVFTRVSTGIYVDAVFATNINKILALKRSATNSKDYYSGRNIDVFNVSNNTVSLDTTINTSSSEKNLAYNSVDNTLAVIKNIIDASNAISLFTYNSTSESYLITPKNYSLNSSTYSQARINTFKFYNGDLFITAAAGAKATGGNLDNFSILFSQGSNNYSVTNFQSPNGYSISGAAEINQQIAITTMNPSNPNQGALYTGVLSNESISFDAGDYTKSSGLISNTLTDVDYSSNGDLVVGSFYGISVSTKLIGAFNTDNVVYEKNLDNPSNVSISNISLNLSHQIDDSVLFNNRTIWITVIDNTDSASPVYLQAYYINSSGAINTDIRLPNTYQRTQTIATQSNTDLKDAINLSNADSISGSQGIENDKTLTIKAAIGTSTSDEETIAETNFQTNFPVTDLLQYADALDTLNDGSFNQSDMTYNQSTNKYDSTVSVPLKFQYNLNDMVNSTNEAFIQILIVNPAYPATGNANYFNQIIYLNFSNDVPDNAIDTDASNVSVINVSETATNTVDIPISGLDPNADLLFMATLGTNQNSRVDLIDGTNTFINITTPEVPSNNIPDTPDNPSTPVEDAKSNSLAVGLGVGLGLGIPAVIVGAGGSFIGYRLLKKKRA